MLYVHLCPLSCSPSSIVDRSAPYIARSRCTKKSLKPRH
nr:MAG TPA: hypothetical protein [Caudoviricetes sp.]